MTGDAVGEPADPAGTTFGSGFPVGVVLGASAATALANIPTFLFGAFAVSIRAELGFSPAGIGLAASIAFAASALAAPLVGPLMQALGAVTALRVGVLGGALSLSAIAGVVNSWLGLALCLGVAGVMNSTTQTAANLAIAEHGASQRDGLAFGIKQGAVPLGTTLAGLAVPLFTAVLGWRWAFVAAAVVAVALAAAMPRFILGRNRPRVRRSRRGGQSRPAGGRVDWPILALVTGGAFFASGSALALSVYFVEYAVTVGWREGPAGTLLAASSILGVSVRVLAGWWIDRRHDAPVPESALVPAGLLMAGGVPGLLLLIAGETWPPALVIGAPLMLGIGWSWAGLMHYSIVSLNRGASAVATGVLLFGVFGGGVVIPSVLGLIAERTSYSVAWGVAAAAVSLAAGAFLTAHGLLLRRRRP